MNRMLYLLMAVIVLGAAAVQAQPPIATKVEIYFGLGNGPTQSAVWDINPDGSGDMREFISHYAHPSPWMTHLGVYVLQFRHRFIRIQTMAGNEFVYSGMPYVMQCQGPCVYE